MKATLYGSNTSESFSKASTSILSFLKKTLGFDLLIVTRLDGDEIIVLDPDNKAHAHEKDAYFKLVDAFCTNIVKGEGLCVATKPEEFSVYAKVEAFKNLEVGAYLGAPIYFADQSLFGTLCAISRTPKEEYVKVYLPMLETFAAVLGNLLDAEVKIFEQSNLAKNASTDSIMDTITPLYNRRGWDIMTAIEESRAKQYGQPLSIISIDLDGLKKINDTYGHVKGGEYITNAGNAIKETIRPYDIASRTGGDEYNILLVDCDDVKAEKMASTIKLAFQAKNISGSFGVAQLKYTEKLLETMDRADRKMYEDKNTKKARAAAIAAAREAAAS